MSSQAQDYTFASRLRGGVGYTYLPDTGEDFDPDFITQGLTVYGQVNLNKHFYLGLDYHHTWYKYYYQSFYEDAYIAKLSVQVETTPESLLNPFLKVGVGIGNYCDCNNGLPTTDRRYPFGSLDLGLHVNLYRQRLLLTGIFSVNQIVYKGERFGTHNIPIVGLSYLFGEMGR